MMMYATYTVRREVEDVELEHTVRTRLSESGTRLQFIHVLNLALSKFYTWTENLSFTDWQDKTVALLRVYTHGEKKPPIGQLKPMTASGVHGSRTYPAMFIQCNQVIHQCVYWSVHYVFLWYHMIIHDVVEHFNDSTSWTLGFPAHFEPYIPETIHLFSCIGDFGCLLIPSDVLLHEPELITTTRHQDRESKARLSIPTIVIDCSVFAMFPQSLCLAHYTQCLTFSTNAHFTVKLI